MKANEAPKTIYMPKELLSEEWTRHIEGMDIEYTRIDVFIEKACKLLARMIWEVTYEDLEGNSVEHRDKMEFIEDFKKYMKGE